MEMQGPQGMYGMEQLSIGQRVSNALFFLKYFETCFMDSDTGRYNQPGIGFQFDTYYGFWKDIERLFGPRESVIWSFIDLFTAPSNSYICLRYFGGFGS